MSDHAGPAQVVLAAAIARRHYLHGQSKVEIAGDLGISRFKVARLLEFARDSGLVRIEIATSGDLDVDLSSRLGAHLRMRNCAVVTTAETDPVTRRRVGRLAGELLTEIIGSEDVLGLPWARTIADMIACLQTLPPVPVVQLSGSLVLPGESSSPVDLVRRAAALSGGESHVYFAPMLLDTAESADSLRRQPSIASAIRAVSRVTLAVVGVGSWGPGISTIYDAATPADRAAVTAAGGIAEVAGVFCDRNGPITTPIDAKLITVTAERLLAIPEVIGVAYGAAKAPGVRAAAHAGLITSLVADTQLARALLDADPPAATGPMP